MSHVASAHDSRKKHESFVLVVARKELLEIFRDGRFAWAAAIMALLLFAGLVTGADRYAAYNLMQQQAQETSNEQFYTQGDKNPHSGAHYGNYAFMKAGPLSFFDNGISPYTGSFVFMEAHRQNLSVAPPAGDTSAIARFGDLNGAMILQILMPLLIIFLGFSAFSGERERGTLRQLMSIGAPKSALLWGKALGVGSAIALVIVPCILVGVVVIASLNVNLSGDGFGVRVLLLALSYSVYAGIFLFVTLAVSAVAASSRTALIALVGFWAFSVFLAPKIAAEISKIAIPSPSLGEFQTSMQETRQKGLDGRSPRQKLAEYRQSLLDKYGVEDVADLPVYWVAVSMQKLEEIDHEVYDHYFIGLADTYLKQRRLQDNIGLIAPVLPLKSLSMGLAGTDLLHDQKFTQAAEQARRDMVEKVNSYLAEMAVEFNSNLKLAPNISTETNDRVLIADEEVFRMVDAFHYEPPSLSAVLNEYRSAFFILSLWLLAAVAASMAAVRNLQPYTR